MKSDNLPSISVVMPVYNSAEFLAESIESILAQSFKDFEFIILDDGSTDRSWEIICDYASKDERIVTFQNEENQGIFFTRNFGLDMSTGQYIAVMDSDDIAMPDRFSKQIAFLDSHPDIDVLGGQIFRFSDNAHSGRMSSYPLTPSAVRWRLLSGCQLAHSTVMMRRHLFSVEGFRYRNYKIAQDYELWIRLSHSHKIANLPDVLVQYRVHQASISHTKDQLTKDETIRIIKAYIKDLSGVDLPENLVPCFIRSRLVKTINQGLIVSQLTKRLYKVALTWNLSPEDKRYISENTASRLRHIWQDQKYHPFLLPYVLYSLMIDPEVIKRKIFRQHYGEENG